MINADWAVSRDLLLNAVLPAYLRDLALMVSERKPFIRALGALRATCRAFRDCPVVVEEWYDVYSHAIIWYMCNSGPNVYWHLTRGGIDDGLVVQFRPATFNCCTLKSLDGNVARITVHEEVSIIPSMTLAADPQKWTVAGWMKPYLMGQCTGPPAFFFDVHRGDPRDRYMPLGIYRAPLHRAVFYRKELCNSFPLQTLIELTDGSSGPILVALIANNIASDGRCRQPLTIWDDVEEFLQGHRENVTTWVTRCQYTGEETVKHFLP